MIHAALRAALTPSAFAFRRALARPEAAQASRLAAVLASLEGTRFADFAKIRTVREFQDAVPLSTAETIAPLVDAMARGERNVLTTDPLVRFEKTGGSSGAHKLVPQTRALLAEFQCALLPWIHDLLASRPATRGPGYWSISPMAKKRETTPGGFPVGAADDVEYFPSFLQGALSRIFAVPSRVAELPDVESCRYATLRILLERADLALISVWNPSFLTLLTDSLATHFDRLLEDLAEGTCRPPNADPLVAEIASSLPLRADRARARAIRHLSPRDIWPSLALISCWTDADAARALPAMRARFPGVEVQSKGLLATEGVVTLPLFDAPAPVLAVRSHFYEFLDGPRALLAHEVEVGRTYEVAITTGAGFLRYRLEDLVRVEGFLGRTPCFSFLGRADAVSDLVGEKLAATRVSSVLAPLHAPFAMLAPEWSAPPAYRLFVETDGDADALASRVEAALLEGASYRYARDLGQLGPVRAVRVKDGARLYEERCISLGQRAGDVKPTSLDRRDGWTAWFTQRERRAA